MPGFAPAFAGTAVVCCVHDQVKRRVTELAFDPSREKLHQCSCCENLFTDRTDWPMFCPACRGIPLHPLGGPLAEPTGAL